MLFADDAGVATSPRGLTRSMDMMAVACQEFGRADHVGKYLWSDSNTASGALLIDAEGQRYKHTTEFLYLGAISESVDHDTEIQRRIGAALASVRRYSS